MLNVTKHTVPVLMILSAILLPLIMREVFALPQGRELYDGEQEPNHGKLENPTTKLQPTTQEQLVKTKEQQENKETSEKPAQDTKRCPTSGQEGSAEWEHHIGIREVNDKPKGITAERHPEICGEHKVKTRQTEVDANAANPADSDFPLDDLVQSLIRQRNDYIAAAAISEAPRPVQAMRVNMNSGLR